MELTFSRARFESGEMPTRTRDGRRVLRIVDSGLSIDFPIAGWVEDIRVPLAFTRWGRALLPGINNALDLVHEPQKVRVGLRRNDRTASGFLPTANPEYIDRWREQGILIAEVEVAIGEGV